MTITAQNSRVNSNGIDPFSIKNIANAMQSDLLGQFDSLYFLRRCAGFPFQVARNADLFFRKIERPVFIVGAPRSGTTFLGNAISVLPSVQYFHEPAATKCAVGHVYLNPNRWERLGRYYRFQYRLLMAGNRKRGRLVEKTPRNCFAISFLNATFPDAKFIHIYRDGCDSALSNSLKHWLHEGQDGTNSREHAGYLLGSKAQFWTEPERIQEFESCTRLRRCAWAWRRYTQSALDQLQMVPADQQLSIRYESLAHSPGQISTELGCFLELGNEQAATLATSLSKVNSDSIGNAKRNLSHEEYDELVAECGEMLSQLKYN